MKFVKNNWILLGIVVVAAILRFTNLGGTPPSMYWDEVSQGYNTYAILTTGHDEHKELLPITRFIAFGDYKAPVYIYLDVPFMALLGKNAFAVRFPSALFGSLTVLVVYFLAKEFFSKQKYREAIALFSAFCLAISPWHIQLSRAAYEGNVATFFTILGIWLFFLAKSPPKVDQPLAEKHKWFLIGSGVSFIMGFYAFNAQRIFIPTLILLLLVIYFKELFQKQFVKPLLLTSAIGLLLLLPFLLYLKSPQSRLRFQEVNIFSDSSIVQQSNTWIQEEGNSSIAKIIHNRRILYGLSYVKHYFDFFSNDFLFITGDINPRFSLRDNGELFLWELPLLLFGIYSLFVLKNKTTALLVGWFLLAPLAAAAARETPHALRAETYLPTYQLLEGLGALALFTFLQKYRYVLKPLLVSFIILVTISLYIFLHDYFVHFPTNYSYEWQYGYKEAVQYTQSVAGNYDRIAFTTTYGRPYIYVLFYGNISAQTYWQEGIVEKDVFGFYDTKNIGKYAFRDILVDPSDIGKRVLYVADPKQVTQDMHIRKKINFLNGQPDFVIASNK